MARNFRTARLMHNLKVIEAAQELGVSQPTLSAWETGRKAPGLESLEKMADFYGVMVSPPITCWDGRLPAS